MKKRIAIEVEVGTVMIRKELPDAWWGSNPALHAEEFHKSAMRMIDSIKTMLEAEFDGVND